MGMHELGAKYDGVSTLALSIWYLAQMYFLAFSAYVLAPGLVYLLSRRRVQRLFCEPQVAPDQPPTDFLLLIPAHNEEQLLPALLASIEQLRYPAAHFRTVVVADNCTDRTAQLARQAGAACLVRTTVGPSSKAQALAFAAAELQLAHALPTTVVCVLDADCHLSPTFLAGLHQHFARPDAAPVVQCCRRVGNAFDSDVTMRAAAAEALRQQVGAGVRHLLGLESLIFGLGCCARGAVFARLVALPLPSLAEDKEWKAYLARHRVPVAYCPAARLSYQAVGSGPAFQKQRKRWLSGHWATVRRHGLPMLGQGLVRGSLSQLDFACDLLQLPRSCLLASALVFGLVAAGTGGRWVLVSGWVWLGLATALLGYGLLGLRLVGAAPRHLRVLLYGGRLVAGIVKSVVLIAVGSRTKEWDATRSQ
jgi:cellulose synthase/poly-beta-1,6-N-acetylglucosamine synthase-like glycosyltransferase